MTERLLIAVGLALVAMSIAAVLKRRAPDAPTQAQANVPSLLNRADFANPEAPWLAVVFSSEVCDSCARVLTALLPLHGNDLAVQDVSFQSNRPLHKRYAINAVPTTLIVDAAGVVRASWVGAFSSTEIWEAIDAAKADA